MSQDENALTTAENPFFVEWQTPFGVPPFRQILPEHYAPAFQKAFTTHQSEIAAIAQATEAPSFDNVIAALERSGHDLQRVSSVFYNLAGSNTNDALQKIEREFAPKMSAHFNAIFQNDALFRKVDLLWKDHESLDLTPEQNRVLERYHTMFLRSGARLGEADKKHASEITQRLATISTSFGQNILADESSYSLVLEGEEDLAGLPDFARSAAAQTAQDRGQPGKHVITLLRSSIEPFLQFSSRRDLREKAFQAWTSRGEGGGETDNSKIITETVALRDERAHLLGFETFADFKLDDTMAKTSDAVDQLLDTVWAPAVARAHEEREELQAMVQAEGGNFNLAAWDWRYYAEKLRKEKHDLKESEIKPYLQLDKIIEAAFDTAHRLFGLNFKEQPDIPLYHEDVRAWEVTYADGTFAGLFLGDYFARPSKRSGAWMSSFRDQQKFDENIRPIIVNVMSFSKGSATDPSLLSFDDALTLFHEFGHGLHGLLSDVTYPLVSGTSVSPDFVELPSQLFEHWLWQPQVLRRFAVHVKTGKPMPDELIERLVAARNFNQGFATVEYLSCAKLDMDLHRLAKSQCFDPVEFEADALEKIGMPKEIVMRHRIPHFAHIFSGEGYAAGYYSYLWSEVMDADAFAAFQEAGDIFDPATAKLLHDNIYSAGGRRDPAEAYKGFRGRLPKAEALLKKRGFA